MQLKDFFKFKKFITNLPEKFSLVLLSLVVITKILFNNEVIASISARPGTNSSYAFFVFIIACLFIIGFAFLSSYITGQILLWFFKKNINVSKLVNLFFYCYIFWLAFDFLFYITMGNIGIYIYIFLFIIYFYGVRILIKDDNIIKDDRKKIGGNETIQLFKSSLNPIKFVKNLPDKFLPLLLIIEFGMFLIVGPSFYSDQIFKIPNYNQNYFYLYIVIIYLSYLLLVFLGNFVINKVLKLFKIRLSFFKMINLYFYNSILFGVIFLLLWLLVLNNFIKMLGIAELIGFICFLSLVIKESKSIPRD